MICNSIFANHSAGDFIIDSTFQYSNLSSFAKVFDDSTNSKDINFIHEKKHELDFIVNGRNIIHKGAVKSICWVKIPIYNNAAITQDLIFQIKNPDINKLQFFIVNKKGIEKSIEMGDHFPFDQRIIKHRYFLYPFSIQPKERLYCYVKIDQLDNFLATNVELWNRGYFVETDNNLNFLYGIFIGLMILYTGISCFLFFYFPQRLTAFYLGWILFLVLLVLTREGFAFQYLWTTMHLSIYEILRPFIGPIQFLFLIYFFKEYLKDTPKHMFSATFLKWGSRVSIFNVAVSILLHFFLGSSFIINILHGYLLIIQSVLFYLLLFHICFLMIKRYLKTRTIENLIGVFVLTLYIIYIIFSLIEIYGWIDSGTKFNYYLFLGFILEISFASVFLFFKFWKLNQQKGELIFTNSQNELKIANTLLQGQTNERLRIAENLQKQLQPILTQSRSIFHKEILSNQSELIQKVEELLEKSQMEVSRIANNLVPLSIYNTDLENNLFILCQSIEESKTIDINFSASNVTYDFSINQKINIYRIIQELLNNVIKHAIATRAEVILKQEGKNIEIIVEDNGIGLSEKEYENTLLLKNKFGSLRFRINSMNGKIHFSRSELSGLKIEIQLVL